MKEKIRNSTHITRGVDIYVVPSQSYHSSVKVFRRRNSPRTLEPSAGTGSVYPYTRLNVVRCLVRDAAENRQGDSEPT
jgi:hypothetical protein